MARPFPSRKGWQYSYPRTYQSLNQNCHEEVCQDTVWIALKNTGGKLKVILCTIDITEFSSEIIDDRKEIMVNSGQP